MIWKKFHNKIDFHYQDQPFVIKGCLDDPSQYVSWQDIETCLNVPQNYSIEAISHYDSSKIELQTTRCFKIPDKEIPIKSELFDFFNCGHTIIIAEYSWHNQKANDLVKELEELYDIACDIHVYCSTKPSKSFNIHDDMPCNIICQVEGKTRWKVYDNRSSHLYNIASLPLEYKLNPDKYFTTLIDEVLEPGDILYIPARQFHAADPFEPRISMSIPCFNTQLRQFEKYDRNQYRRNKSN